MRYTATDSFETMPHPVSKEALVDIGVGYSDLRASILQESAFGLTKLYNRFHSDAERNTRIERLRVLQREMDAAVISAYGWDDLDLEHGFHAVPYLPVSDRIRFTISETARVEVLRRLSELNRQRYEEEVAKGLHSDAVPGVLSRTRRLANADMSQPALDFDAGAEGTSTKTLRKRKTRP
ncbi:TPA: hypothetical protein QDA93_006004 [Burkholderia vietnamiensis]|nr:hypothetical protein [Burkholderia vietnamiensis]